MSEPEPVAVGPAPEPTAVIAETPEQLPPEQLPPERPNKPVMVPVAVVADLREKKRGLEADNERLSRELNEARALAERLQRGDNKDAPAPPRIVPTPQQPPDDVQQAAAQLVMNRDIARVNESGMRAYAGQWNDTVSALTAFGVNTPDFIVDVIDIDPTNAHQIMHDIAQDGEKAVALASMSKARRIAEITKMTMAAERGPDGKFVSKEPPKAPEPPKKVSQAPPPPPPLEPKASKEVDWRSDNSSEEEFQKGFEEMMVRRNRLGRR